ncbi:MAG: putative transcriptional regulator, TetR family, partial [Ilumatobacteraceae bacterium]|nr:putative transcriptional regulator, TetR family [Ilumatobacteraceae bacterium]
MEPHVNRRAYDGVQRQVQSAASRQRIIDQARTLFLAQGYRTTTIADIAMAAEVNPDTVYRLVGRKSAVLRELIEQALSGTDHAIAGQDRGH